jgi:glycerol kinase
MEKDSGITLKELRVDGGAAANNLLIQLNKHKHGKKGHK